MTVNSLNQQIDPQEDTWTNHHSRIFEKASAAYQSLGTELNKTVNGLLIEYSTKKLPSEFGVFNEDTITISDDGKKVFEADRITNGDGHDDTTVKSYIPGQWEQKLDALSQPSQQVVKETTLRGNFEAAALKVGDHMKDGTIVFAVDRKTNTALFAPDSIFAGSADFYHQDDVVAQANAQNLDGHEDWRRVTDKEASILAKNWDKVAPPAQQNNESSTFWGASAHYPHIDGGLGRVYNGGKPGWENYHRNHALPVPVIRSGPARI